MFRNYVVVALRNLVRQKLFSFLNIAGLAVGLACAIFIVLFLRDEMSYDAWEPGSKNVYQIATTFDFPGAGIKLESHSAPFPLGAAMKEKISEVAAATRLAGQNATVQIGSRQFSEAIAVVDPNFFTVIRLPFLRGDATRALEKPESAVLTAAQAKKYFGDTDPIGRTLLIDAKQTVSVSAVIADPPHNSQFQRAVTISNKSKVANSFDFDQWFALSYMTYLRLAPGADIDAVAQKTKTIVRQNANPRQFVQTSLTGDQVLKVKLLKLSESHLDAVGSNSGAGTENAGSWTMVYGFAAIAALILAIAAFNFTNLATARAMQRSREVALRKTVGATRRQLIVQFLSESVLTAILALILALAAVEILLPLFDSVLNRPIGFHYLKDWPLTLAIVLMTIATGLLSGLYPAFVLSRFRPGSVLKTHAGADGGSGRLRGTLVVLQFAISIGLGVGAMVVYAQIDLAKTIDLGYNRDNIVVLNNTSELTAQTRKSFENRLQSSPDIAGVGGSSTVPFNGTFQGTFVSAPASTQNITARLISAEPDYFRLYGLRLIAGRFLDERRGEDSVDPPYPSGDVAAGKNVLIDETMSRLLGFTPEQAIGKMIRIGTVSHTQVRVVGVIGNAKYFGIARNPDPIVYAYKPNMVYTVSVRVKGGHIAAALAHIDRTWHEFVPTKAVNRSFLDDSFNAAYVSIERQGRMFAVFVAIAIFIAALGLFGLAAFTAARRTKEIGIRKVFGAATSDLVRLLVWQFTKPVLLANLIAWPLAWYALHWWLETYAYRVSLSPFYFVAAGLAALAIAWATVIAHALQVARANPIAALRYE
jgi:putative ABC transport system permease protein